MWPQNPFQASAQADNSVIIVAVPEVDLVVCKFY